MSVSEDAHATQKSAWFRSHVLTLAYTFVGSLSGAVLLSPYTSLSVPP